VSGERGRRRSRAAASAALAAALAVAVVGFTVGAVAVGAVAVGAVAVGAVARTAAAPAPEGPPARSPARHAVLLLVGGLPWAALRDASLPGLQLWVSRGAVAAMNTQGAGRDLADAYLTIGAGSRATATGWAGEAYEAGERLPEGVAADLYGRNTGRPAALAAPAAPIVTGAAGLSTAVHLGLAALQARAAAENHLVVPGALGEELRRAGLGVAVLGNSDAVGKARRFAALVAMDARGLVPEAFIGHDATRAEPAAAGGLLTDWDALQRAFSQAWTNAGFIVIDEGDIGRITAALPVLAPAAAGALTRQALQDLDGFLAFLARSLDTRRDLFILASVVPAEGDAAHGEGLAPLVVAGPGVPGGGVLSSPTVRRRALAANIDLAPTVLRHFGLQAPPWMYGAPVHGTAAIDGAAGDAASNAVGEADRLRLGARAAQVQRAPLIRGYITAEVVVLLAAAWLILAPKPPARAPGAASAAFLALAAVPLALLLAPVSGATAPLPAAGVIAALTAVLAAAGRLAGGPLARRLLRERAVPPFAPFLAVALATLAAVAGDALAGGELAATSALGYSLISGARYYGVGNEYAGVLAGAGVFAAAALAELARPGPALIVTTLAVGLPVTALLASPAVGANVGGAMAAAVGFGYLLWRASGRRLGLKGLFALLGAAAAAFLAMAGADLLRHQAPSHLARTLVQVQKAGIGVAVDVIARKVALNIKLVRYTIWSRVLLVTLGTFAVVLYRPVGLLRQALGRYPRLRVGLEGVVAASVAALAFNDSGVVAAATALIFASAPLAAVLLANRTPGTRIAGPRGGPAP